MASVTYCALALGRERAMQVPCKRRMPRTGSLWRHLRQSVAKNGRNGIDEVLKMLACSSPKKS